MVGCADVRDERDASADSAIETDARTVEREASTAPDAPQSDASAPSDAATPSDGAAVTCEPIESAYAPAPQTCAEPAVVLGSAGTLVADRIAGVDTYALANVVAQSDGHTLTGDDVRATSWVDGDDATVHFRAPRGGKWRFTARGVGAFRITARRACAPSEASSTWQRELERSSEAWPVMGPEVSSTVAIERFAQRDERFDLVIDGCERGSRCSFEVRAERVAELACAPGNACGDGDWCFIDRCDSERYACVTQARMNEIVPDRVSARFEGSMVVVSGTTANWPRNLPPIVRALEYELLDASGALAPHASSSPTASIRGGWFPWSQTALYPRPEVAKIRVWFAPLVGRTSRRSVVADIERTPSAPLVLGDRCVPTPFTDHCPNGLLCLQDEQGQDRCLPLAPVQTGVVSMRANAQLYVDSLSPAYNGPRIVVDVVGTRRPAGSWRAKAYDADANELATESVECFDGPATTTTSAAASRRFVCVVLLRNDAIERVARVRLEATGVVLETNVTSLPESAHGESCGVAGSRPWIGELARCARGLECSNYRCALPRFTEHHCYGAAPSAWTSSGATSTLTGATRSTVYSRSCGGSSGMWLPFDFVATTAGAYRFATSGPVTATAQRYCDGRPCWMDPVSMDNVVLSAGERLSIRVSATSAAPTYSITATRL